VQYEDSKFSDLANSCEYLTLEKTCFAVSDSEKAKATRELRCQNSEKKTCCYLCHSRRECAISCKYLGSTKQTVSFEPENTSNKDKTEVPQTEKAPMVCCSLCNTESQGRTKFRIDGGKDHNQTMVS
jgi:hypothetical protein